ncbi:MAG TPA: Hpt domain-containing protein [Candidatus Binatia bacterium]|nr:Hpt domain-containing protein [Candidatus Binatia bacterium]
MRDAAKGDPTATGAAMEAAGAVGGGARGMSVATIRELFRIEARELLAGMGHRLAQLDDAADGRALAEVAARGHALKGSAALAELPQLSRAGAVLQRAAEMAVEVAERNRHAARQLVRATRAALEPAQRMLDDCLEGTGESQDRLFDEMMAAFDARERRLLESDVNRDEASRAAEPEFEEREDLVPKFAPPEDPATASGPASDPELAAMLAETFVLELTELLGEVPETLLRMMDPAQQADLCADLGRVFHTVKGSAATVGRDDLRDLGMQLQNAFEAIADGAEPLPLRPEFFRSVAPALGEVFLAAGLEPPASALQTLADASAASLVDEDGAPSPRDRADAALAQAPAAASDAGANVEREIMEAFFLDADAALEASETALLKLERNPRDQKQLRVLFRQFHTLKGAAAAVGLNRIAEQLHAGETLLESIIEGAATHDPDALVELLLQLVDSVAGLLAESRGVSHEHRILSDVAARIDEVLARAAAPLGAASEPTVIPTGPPGGAPAAATREPSSAVVSGGDPESAIVRVHASRLDLLMNRVSELVVSRTRMEDTMSAVHELKDKLSFGRLRVHETIEGFRGFEFHPAPQGDDGAGDAPAARAASSTVDFTDLEFDKYDDFNLLVRTLVELAADTGEIVEQLGGLIETMAEETRQVSKVTSSLQRTITGMRLLSLDTLFRRLQRPTREAARQVGKQVDLLCIGGEVQVDRALIESLYGPLLHLVRNAVSHGLEPLVDRRAAGKPDVGMVEIRAVQRHGSVDITLRDDGRGLDFEAIRAKGIATGLLEPDAAATRDDLAALIFRPGFSTRSQVTDLAGRGIGMDVVAGEVEQLRGSVSVESRDGKGALFRITLPLTAVIDQVLLLRAGDEVYALSHGPIETVVNVDPEEVARDGARRVRVGDDVVPAVSLTALVGARARGTPATAIVLRAADHRIALLVDRVEAQREAVVRPLGRLFAGHPFVTSATFSGDGQVIFVIDAARLEAWLATAWSADADPADVGASTRAASPSDPDARDGAPDAASDEATVLWADDSISVRRLAAHLLAAEGFTSRTAVDGRDALEKLRSGSFRVLVTDLEMPRMHGYELLHEIRSDPRLKDLPVIVCTSRSSDKHRRAASEAGASGYLTKPFTREAMAAALREALGPSSG